MIKPKQNCFFKNKKISDALLFIGDFTMGLIILEDFLNKEPIKPFETAGINAKIIENQIVMNDTSESAMNSKTLAKNKSYHIMSKK